MDTIDIHAHIYPTAYVDAVSEIAGRDRTEVPGVTATLRNPFVREHPLSGDDAIDERLRLMDAAGIRRQVLSLGAPNVWHPEPAERLRLCGTFNDACTAVCAQQPERFSMLATLPLPFIDICLEELNRVAASPHVEGVCLPANVEGSPIDKVSYAPVYERLDELGAVVFFHPDGRSCGGQLEDYAMDWAVGALVDDAVVAVRLVYSGLLERYPSVRWVVPHLGGVLPVLWQRLDDFYHHEAPFLQQLRPTPPSAALPTIFYDTVTSQPEVIALMERLVGPGRLVLGSDFPYRAAGSLAEPLETVRASGLATAAVRAIARGNLERILPSERHAVADDG